MTARTPRRIGYLTNVYPAVSHSFIKREILALEEQGYSIKRWSIRPSAASLPDATDRAEADRTEVILSGPGRLILGTLRMMLKHPGRFVRCLGLALKGREAGLRAALVRFAYLAEACCLVQSAKRHQVDHVHAHFGTNPATVARLAYRLGGPTYSFTVHGPDEFDQPVLHDLSGKIADARFVAAISDYGRSQLMRWSAMVDWPRLAVVRCGLDAAFIDAQPAPIPDDAPPELVCVARLAPQKGLPLLIEAAARLKALGHSFRIVVVGDGDLRSLIAERIARHGLQDCVELRGAASMDGVRAALLAARAFVLPSFAEGLPVSIMEALALGRPVITTRIAGIPELVDDSCGRLVHAGEVEGLCHAMAELLQAPAADLRAMGEAGRQRVLAAHNARINAGQLARLFQADDL